MFENQKKISLKIITLKKKMKTAAHSDSKTQQNNMHAELHVDKRVDKRVAKRVGRHRIEMSRRHERYVGLAIRESKRSTMAQPLGAVIVRKGKREFVLGHNHDDRTTIGGRDICSYHAEIDVLSRVLRDRHQVPRSFGKQKKKGLSKLSKAGKAGKAGKVALLNNDVRKTDGRQKCWEKGGYFERCLSLLWPCDKGSSAKAA